MTLQANSEDLKNLLLEKNEPIIIKSVLKWDMLNWTLNDWKTALNNEEMEFRCGINEKTNQPQWERNTPTLKGDFEYFLDFTEKNEKKWLYFDYKQLNAWFSNNEKLRQEIDWSSLGFPDIKPDDSTIWIGSKGAHTSCHMDCYGFNLVHQIYGSKLWLLFPPEENLKPTRVPYEESSIYSKFNFFSPQTDDFQGNTNKCRKCILNPGDVLFVPHKWWHYVENLETSITINAWCPSKEDDEERLQESIVQFFIKQMSLLASEETDALLNPNMDELIIENDSSSFLDTLLKCKDICSKNNKNKRGKRERELTKREVEEETRLVSYETIPVLSKEDFILFLQQQSNRFHNSIDVQKNTSDNLELIDSITNPQVINLIKDILLKHVR
ncbi:unnamed protein product [Phyllotreta striolata]|uniref:JmjC domain-containing protein n=1 Tax=Phyllotreta striolata TaxID=444603 RepID=A0A9N9TJZ6_PHYSR|nr:unnamed protein product [Phyllotreta striolata]